MKYNKKMVIDYIRGEDIKGYDLETLEDDHLFMIDVLKYSRDKKMYEFCSDRVKENYEFINFVLDNFKDDIKFVQRVVDRYILKYDDINSFELVIKIADLTNDLSYRVKAQMYLEAVMTQINILIHSKKNPKTKKDLGMGFICIIDSYSSNETIMNYFAKYFINKIFYTEDLEKILHKKHHKYEEIEKGGINKYLIDYIKSYDDSLAAYIACHLDLIEDIKHEFISIKNKWDVYLYNLNQQRVDAVYQETYNYVKKNNPTSILTTFEYIYYAIKELHLEKEYFEFENIELFIKNDLEKIPDIIPLEIIKKDIEYMRCYNHVLEFIKKLYKYDVIEAEDFYEYDDYCREYFDNEKTKNNPKILNIDFKKKDNK